MREGRFFFFWMQKHPTFYIANTKRKKKSFLSKRLHFTRVLPFHSSRRRSSDYRPAQEDQSRDAHSRHEPLYATPAVLKRVKMSRRRRRRPRTGECFFFELVDVCHPARNRRRRRLTRRLRVVVFGIRPVTWDEERRQNVLPEGGAQGRTIR